MLESMDAVLAQIREGLKPLSGPVYAPVISLAELLDEDLD